MEYAGAIGVQALKHAVDVDQRAIITVEGLDLTVMDWEMRQGNLGGIQGAVANECIGSCGPDGGGCGQPQGEDGGGGVGPHGG